MPSPPPPTPSPPSTWHARRLATESSSSSKRGDEFRAHFASLARRQEEEVALCWLLPLCGTTACVSLSQPEEKKKPADDVCRCEESGWRRAEEENEEPVCVFLSLLQCIVRVFQSIKLHQIMTMTTRYKNLHFHHSLFSCTFPEAFQVYQMHRLIKIHLVENVKAE